MIETEEKHESGILVESDDNKVDLNLNKEVGELESFSFNEIDLACMLINPHIRLSVRGLAKKIIFSNSIAKRLRDIIMEEDNNDSSQRIVSKLFVDYSGMNFDKVKEKLDMYFSLVDREDINHYLKLLNYRIKTDSFDKSADNYYKNKDIDAFIKQIDEISNGLNSSVIPFSDLNKITGEELTESFEKEALLPSSLAKLNSCCHYKALLKSQLVIVAAPPGVGKSQFLINETYHHAKNDKKVVYLAMGDMLESDFKIKLGCLHFDVNIDEFLNNATKYVNDKDFMRIMSNIKLSVLGANEIYTKDVVSYYKADPEIMSADVFIFDYDSNFADMNLGDMYSAHETIYNNIYKLTKLTPAKLTYIASQVKNSYFNTEFIPMQALAESSRKQAIADVIVTISSKRHDSHNCGIINMVKMRRGILGFTPFTLTQTGKITQIDMQMYRQFKQIIEQYKNTEMKN